MKSWWSLHSSLFIILNLFVKNFDKKMIIAKPKPLHIFPDPYIYLYQKYYSYTQFFLPDHCAIRPQLGISRSLNVTFIQVAFASNFQARISTNMHSYIFQIYIIQQYWLWCPSHTPTPPNWFHKETILY